MAKKAKNSPEVQGAKKPKGGVPPVEYRFKPGQSGNPAGRQTAGAYVQEYMNSLSCADVSEKELRAIARDKELPWAKRTAAERMLRTIEAGDLADFAPVFSGKSTLEELRATGVNTEVVKKIKQKSRMVPTGDGQAEEVIDREIELHDRAGGEFDRIMDRTIGKPNQAVDISSKGQSIVKVLKGVSMDQL